MGVSMGFAIRAGTGKGSGGDPLTLALKTIDIQEEIYKADGGGSITDPYYLQRLVESASSLSDLVKDEGDKLKLAGKIASWQASMSSLERTKTSENISYALDSNIKESKYNALSNYADRPVDYLKSIASGYYAMADLGQAEIDNLESIGRYKEANTLKEKIKNAQKEVDMFDRVQSAIEIGDQEALKNFAAVYRTDSFGKVVDMGVRNVASLSVDSSGNIDTVGNDVVPLIDKDGNDILVDGMKIFVNKQNEMGFDYVKIGGQTVQVGKRREGYDLQGNAIVDENYGFQQSGSPVAKLTISQDDFYKNTTIAPAKPATVNKVGTYAITAKDRVFRFNKDLQWDEIAKDALPQFADYNEQWAVKVPDVNSEQLMYNSGKLITSKDLAPMTMINEPVFNKPQETQPGQNMSVAPIFSGNPSSAQSAIATRTNRFTGMVRPSGQQNFNTKTQQLFSGNPSP